MRKAVWYRRKLAGNQSPGCSGQGGLRLWVDPQKRQNVDTRCAAPGLVSAVYVNASPGLPPVFAERPGAVAVQPSWAVAASISFMVMFSLPLRIAMTAAVEMT